MFGVCPKSMHVPVALAQCLPYLESLELGEADSGTLGADSGAFGADLKALDRDSGALGADLGAGRGALKGV